MTARRRHRVDANGVGLSVLEIGPEDAPPLVMLHGMRDVAWSLLPIAERLAERRRVLLPDLRGHGDSDRPGVYTIEHFLFDLLQVLDAAGADAAALFGHSLGGQIVARFSALFPARVRAAVIVEGLGPPGRPWAGDEAAELAAYAERIVQTLSIPPRQRPLPDLDFAAQRLRINNPRLARARARALAEHATRRNAAGELVWAFDPRVPSVFLGSGVADGERYWRRVPCPTLIVTGDLAHEYWRAQMPIEWDGRFAPGELEARIRCFPDVEHRAFADAGHMVHYDRPDDLAEAVADFLERRA